MITCAYPKSSNSLGFNPIFQKFCKIIFEIIFSKMVHWIFLIFCRLRFINNIFVKNNFSEPWNPQKPKVKYLKRHLIQKDFLTPFWRSYFTNKLEWFFSFVGLGLFHDYKSTHSGVIFLHKKFYINFILFNKLQTFLSSVII